MDPTHTEPGDRSTYGLANAWDQARQRLAAIEAWLDPGTILHLAACGVGPAWRCLEVGAGGGSIARWLSERVGPDGHVVATDLDTRFVERLAGPNLTVTRHDITVDALDVAAFDLVHCRLLLAHLGDRTAAALRRLVEAVRPGGWIVVEEMDFVSVVTDDSKPGGPEFLAAVAASNEVLRRRGFDPHYGRRVHDTLAAQGLTDVACAGRSNVWHGGSPGATAWSLTFEQLRGQMLVCGASGEEIDTAIARCNDPSFSFMSQVTIVGSGRRA